MEGSTGIGFRKSARKSWWSKELLLLLLWELTEKVGLVLHVLPCFSTSIQLLLASDLCLLGFLLFKVAHSALIDIIFRSSRGFSLL